MQGVKTADGKRIPTKKALKEMVKGGGEVVLEATSIFGNEYDGLVSKAPTGSYVVVVPDPYRSRKWYAKITVNGNGTVTVQ
tara:strand:+ start:923 stop:1165 length:243 start_codon:yes stop_codon:yes gene_type:complete